MCDTFKESVCVVFRYPACKGRVIGLRYHVKCQILVAELGENMEHRSCADNSDSHVVVCIMNKLEQMSKRLFFFIFVECTVVNCRRLSCLMVAVNNKIIVNEMLSEACT